MRNNATTPSPENLGRLLLVASALVTIGVLPSHWRGRIAIAGAVLTVIKML